MKFVPMLLVVFLVLFILYGITYSVCAWLRDRKAKCMCSSWDECQILLESSPVPLVASCGTLLGAIREGHVIDNDDDIDLMVKHSDWDSAVEHFKSNYDTKNFSLKIRDSGNTLTLYPKSCKPVGGIDLYKMTPDPVSGKFHLFGVDLEPDAIEPGERLKMSGPKRCGKSVPGSIQVPTNPTLFLKSMYGNNWKTPQYLFKGNTTWRPINILHAARRCAAKIGLYV